MTKPNKTLPELKADIENISSIIPLLSNILKDEFDIYQENTSLAMEIYTLITRTVDCLDTAKSLVKEKERENGERG